LKLQIASDIHYDHFPSNANSPIKPVGDVLILAGDTAANPEMMYAFLCRFKYAIPIIAVLGNHEYFFTEFNTGHFSYRKVLEMFNKRNTLLQCSTMTIDDVTFIGATLWSTYAGGTHLGACMRGAWELSSGSLNPEEVVKEHHSMTRFIEEAVMSAKIKGNKTVVITHHTPSFRCGHPSFAASAINGLFHNDMDNFVEKVNPDLWICGHVHDSIDLMIGDTRVVGNPHGYYEAKNPNFNPEFIVEV